MADPLSRSRGRRARCVEKPAATCRRRRMPGRTPRAIVGAPQDGKGYRSCAVHSFTGSAAARGGRDTGSREGDILVLIVDVRRSATLISTAAHGDWPVKPSLPFVPGHEGRRHRRSSSAHGVTRRARAGKRVAVALARLRACGASKPLRIGLRDALPAAAKHRLLDRRRLRRVRVGRRRLRRPRAGRRRPARRSAADLRRRHDLQGRQGLRRRSSDLVAVFGIGGLGHLAVQYAQIAGGTVVAVELQDDKLAVAQRARRRVHGQRRRARTRRRRSRRSAAPTPRSPSRSRPRRSAGLTLVPPRRQARLVALPAENAVEIPIFETVLERHHDRRLDRRHAHDLAEVFELHAAGARASSARSGRSPRSTRRSRTSRRAGYPPGRCSSSDTSLIATERAATMRPSPSSGRPRRDRSSPGVVVSHSALRDRADTITKIGRDGFE